MKELIIILFYQSLNFKYLYNCDIIIINLLQFKNNNNYSKNIKFYT